MGKKHGQEGEEGKGFVPMKAGRTNDNKKPDMANLAFGNPTSFSISPLLFLAPASQGSIPVI